MNPKSKIMLAVVVGAALGAATVQGLHAQVKPKAYSVVEFEVLVGRGLAHAVALAHGAVGNDSHAHERRLLDRAANSVCMRLAQRPVKSVKSSALRWAASRSGASSTALADATVRIWRANALMSSWGTRKPSTPCVMMSAGP